MTSSVDQWQAAVDAEKPKRGRKVRVAEPEHWTECDCGKAMQVIGEGGDEVECACGRVWPLGGG